MGMLSWEECILMTLIKRLRQFESLTFPKGFGFDAFTEVDLNAFLTQPSMWSFGLKKERGKGILYGKCHTDIRCQLVNDRP